MVKNININQKKNSFLFTGRLFFNIQHTQKLKIWQDDMLLDTTSLFTVGIVRSFLTNTYKKVILVLIECIIFFFYLKFETFAYPNKWTVYAWDKSIKLSVPTAAVSYIILHYFRRLYIILTSIKLRVYFRSCSWLLSKWEILIEYLKVRRFVWGSPYLIFMEIKPAISVYR